MEPENRTKNTEVKVLHVKTKDVKENKKASSVENNSQDKVRVGRDFKRFKEWEHTSYFVIPN